MKSLIIYKSVHHGNTKKIAEVIADELGAELCSPKEVSLSALNGYELIGFGSGIYGVGHHKEIRDLVRRLPLAKGKKAFVFSTSGTGSREFSRVLISQLSKKGYKVIGDFACRGFDTFGPLKLIGGISKGKPDAEDLSQAREFARTLK